MHLQLQDALRKPTADEARAHCKHTCKHIGCGQKFGNKHGLRVHQGKCKYKDVYEVESILDMRRTNPVEGTPAGYGKTEFLVKWKGYGDHHNRWRPYEDIAPDTIKDYLQENGLWDHDWPHRCPNCDKPAKSATGVKIHQARSKECKNMWTQRQQNFAGTEAERKAKEQQKEDQQKDRPVILCEGEPLKNCYLFKYLGSIFAADGSDDPDVRRRIGIAKTRAGQLRHVLGSKHIKVGAKIKLYNAAVVSLFTYGCEGWVLTPKVLRQLNGANSGLLSHFTGKETRVEARPLTTSLDLTKEIRRRRLCWLGHILRMGPERLVRSAVEEQFAMGGGGSMFMDAPVELGLAGMTALALADEKRAWREMTRQLR